ncbi:hypothetical protein P4H61_11080 [Paenibacillus peoriae]|uniref:hypothetical protein n=1 Tax=Paenibacillus peoriae TaxID=59893 RepID=UPI00026C6730|nr:hypothetical protein [Paenibacillus peoriae]MEC0182035.1 hypothetical protein [Paenibacillus peoriae]
MNKRLRTIVVVLGLTVLVGGVITVIQSQTFANETITSVKVTDDSNTNETKTEVKASDNSNVNETKAGAKATDDSNWLSPERKKELNHLAQSKQPHILLTEHGDFYPVKVPNKYPSDQVANLDNDGEEITAKTKQVILRNFTYEKKEEEN